MSNEIWRWSAEETARAIRTRAVSSREAVQSVLARVNEVNPRINAVVDLMPEEALAAAERADKAVKDGAALGPLHGVPVTVKINVDYAGRATTNGVVAFKNNIAKADSATVLSLKRSGAVIFGRTNTPAFSHRGFTDNDLHGRTLNPWDAKRTPGGSSGGAGAAVCAGMGAIAHGNDRAGSVRYPGYACGVFGLRPSFGRVPDYQPSALEERGLYTQLTLVNGPLGRSVSDVRLGLAALESHDPGDPWAFPPGGRSEPLPRPIPVAMATSVPGVPVDPHVVAALQRAAKLLEGAGYRVEEVELPHLREAGTMFWTLIMTEERAASAQEQGSSTQAIELYGDEKVKRARAGNRAYAGELDFNAYIRALARRTTLLREWRFFLKRFPVVLLPVSAMRPLPIDFDQGGNDAMRQLNEAWIPMLAISTLGLPGLSVPAGFVEGVPVGVQIVADRFQEERCFAAAEVIEAAYPTKIP